LAGFAGLAAAAALPAEPALAVDFFFFFGLALAVCTTVSGRSAGPVNTTTGAVVSTGGPSTNLPFAGFKLDSMKAWPELDSPLAAVVVSALGSSSSLSSDAGLRR
jgi:hypothetical protein